MIVEPTRSARPPHRRRQRLWLRTTTSGVPTGSSSGVMVRPYSGATPSTAKKSPVTFALGTCSAGPSPVNAAASAEIAASDSKASTSRRQSTKSGGALVPRRESGLSSDVVASATRRSGSGNGSGRSSTARTAPKMAALAPIPTARLRTATSVNPGRFCRKRAAYLMSCQITSHLQRSARNQTAWAHAPTLRIASCRSVQPRPRQPASSARHSRSQSARKSPGTSQAARCTMVSATERMNQARPRAGRASAGSRDW